MEGKIGVGGTRSLGPLIAALAIVAGACGGPTASSTPGASAAPSPSTAAVLPTAPLPSAGPSIAPSLPLPTSTTGPSPTTSGFVVYPELGYVDKFAMRVGVSDLNVRRKPSTSGISEGKAEKGQLFMVYDWPITANGYQWYLGYQQLQDNDAVPKLPQPYNDGYDEILGGWMATGTEDTPFLIPVGPRCPDVRDLRNVGGMLGSERVACFGSESLTLEGTFGCEGCGGAPGGTFEPEWLASPLEFGFLSTGEVDEAAPLSLHFAPAGPARPAQGARLRLRGHFSDDRSTTCRITELDEGDALVPIANAAAEQWCRSKFVVESYEVIGP